MNALSEKVISLMALNIREEYIKPTDSLEYDLKLDSLDRVELLMELEEAFEINIDDSVALGWVTVKDVIAHVKHIEKEKKEK